MEIKEIINAALEMERLETDKSGLELFAIAREAGIALAKKLGADADIVALGTIFMDFKLSECLRENKLSEHVQRSAAAADKFLKTQDLPAETVAKVISCVESHHGREKYDCPEAEICANADCYKFLTPRGLFLYLTMLGGRGQSLAQCLDQVEFKMEEKHNALSLEICKEELEPYYLQFKDLLIKARQGI